MDQQTVKHTVQRNNLHSNIPKKWIITCTTKLCNCMISFKQANIPCMRIFQYIGDSSFWLHDEVFSKNRDDIKLCFFFHFFEIPLKCIRQDTQQCNFCDLSYLNREPRRQNQTHGTISMCCSLVTSYCQTCHKQPAKGHSKMTLKTGGHPKQVNLYY